jgi:hypothetical protein
MICKWRQFILSRKFDNNLTFSVIIRKYPHRQGLIIGDEKISLLKDGGYMQKMWSAR